MGDGRYTIFLNTKSRKDDVSQKLGSFLRYVDTGDVDSEDRFLIELDEKVRDLSKNKVGDNIMTIQDLIDKEVRIAKAETEAAKAETEAAKAETEAYKSKILRWYQEGAITAEAGAEFMEISVEEFLEIDI